MLAQVSDLLGCTLVNVEYNGYDEIVFTLDNGVKYKMLHYQDCCEHVAVEDITGDLKDLIGSPILKAEEVISNDEPKPETYESYTWTFYHFATVKGYVTIRWYGESNGYYSESVDFERMGV
jgi:hypothetical protein